MSTEQGGDWEKDDWEKDLSEVEEYLKTRRLLMVGYMLGVTDALGFSRKIVKYKNMQPIVEIYNHCGIIADLFVGDFPFIAINNTRYKKIQKLLEEARANVLAFLKSLED